MSLGDYTDEYGCIFFEFLCPVCQVNPTFYALSKDRIFCKKLFSQYNSFLIAFMEDTRQMKTL